MELSVGKLIFNRSSYHCVSDTLTKSMVSWKIGPALATGNTVVLKVSPPLCPAAELISWI